MADINETFKIMIAEMQRYGATPAPSKGGSYNNMLRYRETREKILERFLAVFADGYRMGKEDDAPTITSSGWVSVEERLPRVGGNYICAVQDKNGGKWTIPSEWNLEMKTWFGAFGEIKNKVTHWMPLPAPPDRRPPEGEEDP